MDTILVGFKSDHDSGQFEIFQIFSTEKGESKMSLDITY